MSQAYLLLDRAQIEHLQDRLFELTDGATCHSLYLHTAYSPLDDVGPALVEVSEGSPLADFFWRHWSATAGIWLESEAGLRCVMQHLRSLVHARVEGGVIVLFRYYDPRIAALWLEHLAPPSRDRLMGPVRLIRLAGAEFRQQQPDQPVAQYAETPWLFLTNDELEQLSAAKRQYFTRQLIEHCQRFFPHAMRGLDSEAQQRWALRCQNSAVQHGFSGLDDILRWARLHAELGSDFPDNPDHAVYRQKLTAPGISSAQRLDNLEAELTHQSLTAKEFPL